jgi:predicted Zn-dependent protease
LRLAIVAVLVALSLAGWRYVRAHYLQPRAHWEAAQRALEQRDSATALTELHQYVDARPKDAAARFLLARTARRAGVLDEAEEELALCRRLQEEQKDTTSGDTALEWDLLQAQCGNLPAVEGSLRARLKEDHPDAVLILEALSGELIRNNRIADARECLDKWVERQPDDFLARVRRGWVLEHLLTPNLLDLAIDDLFAALNLDPERDQLRLHLAELLVERNRMSEAREHLQLLKQRQPENAGVLTVLARVERSEGNTDKAGELLGDVLARDPAYNPAVIERGILAVQTGQFADAEKWLTQGLKRNPSDTRAVYNLSTCLERLGKKKEAKELEHQLVERKAEMARLSDLTRQALNKPNDPELRYQVGLILMHNGYTDDSLRWLSTALKRDPGHRATHRVLADYYERIGNREQAAEHRRYLGN